MPSFAALCGVRPVRVSERDPHGDARAALVHENPEDPSILGKEQRAVRQDVNLALGRSEQPHPDLPRNGPPVRVDRPQLLRPAPRRQQPARIRPQLGLVRADELGDRGPVVRIRHAPVQPPPDRLGIHAQAGGDVIFAQPRPQQGPAQWLVHRRHLQEREDTPDRTRRRP